MSWTKRQFVQQAFDEIGLAPYIYEPTLDQMTAAVRRLDAMMATWNAMGVRVGYPLPATPESTNIESRTDVPDMANEAVFLNLAVRLAPGYGKPVSIETKTAAKAAFSVLLAHTSKVVEQRLPGSLPLGAGHKGTQVFVTPTSVPFLTGRDGILELT